MSLSHTAICIRQSTVLDPEHYDLVLFLSHTASALPPQFLDKIYNAYDAGIQAVQLHTVIENHKGFRNHFCAIRRRNKKQPLQSR